MEIKPIIITPTQVGIIDFHNEIPIVLTITNIRNFGDLIILDHGAGYYTVYSNLENINVYENQYIDSNTYLAQVAKGSNYNYPEKYVFNFQVWSNEEKVDPQKWLKK